MPSDSREMRFALGRIDESAELAQSRGWKHGKPKPYGRFGGQRRDQLSQSNVDAALDGRGLAPPDSLAAIDVERRARRIDNRDPMRSWQMRPEFIRQRIDRCAIAKLAQIDTRVNESRSARRDAREIEKIFADVYPDDRIVVREGAAGDCCG
jgi:hypothetical protein